LIENKYILYEIYRMFNLNIEHIGTNKVKLKFAELSRQSTQKKSLSDLLFNL
jgi:hypothetical protein